MISFINKIRYENKESWLSDENTCENGGKTKNEPKKETMADSRLRGTLIPKMEKNPTGKYCAREDT